MKALKRVAFAVSFLSVVAVSAQVQTYTQCVETVQARANLSVTKAQIRDLCENNSDEVVNCAITQTQGTRFSGDLRQAVKDCRRQYPLFIVN